MLKVLSDSRYGEDIEADARRLYEEYTTRQNLPRISGVTRAVIPTWCDVCGERAWGPMSSYCICPKCRGENKSAVGFGA